MFQSQLLRASSIVALATVMCFSAADASSVDNVDGIANGGAPAIDGGLDSDGYAYAAALLGSSITWGGSSFKLGSAGTFDALTSTTVALPSGRYAAVNLLATAVNGDQRNQTFVVTYTDGTSSTFTQSLSDWVYPQSYAGESKVAQMAYRISSSGSESAGPIYVYGYRLPVDATKTLQSVTLPRNRNVVVLAIAATAGAVSGAGGSASAGDNVVGVVADGSDVKDGGLDTHGYAYSSNYLGGSIAWADSVFPIGTAGSFNAVSATSMALPSGNYSTLNLLATAVNGDQRNQVFTVTYTDGSTASFTQSLSDWYTPQRYSGETEVSQMPERVGASGSLSPGPVYLYGYTLSLNAAKSVKSLTLPNNRNVVVLGVEGSRAGATLSAAAAPTFSPAPGSFNTAQAVKISDSTSQAVIYYTTNGTTPTTSSAQYTSGTSVPISSTTTLKAIAVASGYVASAVTGGSYSITGTTSPPPASVLRISGSPSTSADAGKFYSFTPTVVAPSGAALSYSVTNKPSWGTFNSATGTLSGTPTSAQTDANITVKVSEGGQSAALSPFSIVVAAAAAPSSGSVTLSWSQPTQNTNGTALTNLAGYLIRYGTSSTALGWQISVGSPTSNSVEIGNLSAGTWYFEVAAVNTLQTDSQFSAAVSKSIP
jgi:hypothetical protein